MQSIDQKNNHHLMLPKDLGDQAHLKLSCVKIDISANLIAIGDKQGTLRLYTLSPFVWLESFDAHDAEITTIAFSHNGQLLATGSRDRFIHIVQMSTKQKIQTYTTNNKSYSQIKLIQSCVDHTGSIMCITFASSPKDNKMLLISSGSDKQIIFRAFDHATNKFDRLSTFVSRSIVYDLVVSNQHMFAALSGEQHILLFDLQSAKLQKTHKKDMLQPAIARNATGLFKMSIDPSFSFVATVAVSRDLKLWDLWTGDILFHSCLMTDNITGICWITKIFSDKEPYNIDTISNDDVHIVLTTSDGCILKYLVSPNISKKILSKLWKERKPLMPNADGKNASVASLTSRSKWDLTQKVQIAQVQHNQSEKDGENDDQLMEHAVPATTSIFSNSKFDHDNVKGEKTQFDNALIVIENDNIELPGPALPVEYPQQLVEVKINESDSEKVASSDLTMKQDDTRKTQDLSSETNQVLIPLVIDTIPSSDANHDSERSIDKHRKKDRTSFSKRFRQSISQNLKLNLFQLSNHPNDTSIDESLQKDTLSDDISSNISDPLASPLKSPGEKANEAAIELVKKRRQRLHKTKSLLANFKVWSSTSSQPNLTKVTEDPTNNDFPAVNLSEGNDISTLLSTSIKPSLAKENVPNLSVLTEQMDQILYSLNRIDEERADDYLPIYQQLILASNQIIVKCEHLIQTANQQKKAD